jgi:hypothetical protein
MGKRSLILILGAVALLACSVFAPAAPTATAPPPTSAAVTLTTAPTLKPTLRPPSATVEPTAQVVTPPTLALQPTTTPAPEATATPTGYTLTAGNVRFQPGPRLYEGDVVSVEVIAEDAPPGWQGAPVMLYVDQRGAEPLERENLGRFGLGGRTQATFTWAWDTTGRVGPQTVIVVVAPVGMDGGLPPPEQVLTLTVPLLPAEARTRPEAGAQWARAESVCCIFHYLTGTAAERDIELIRGEADAAFAHVEQALGVTRDRQVVFTLMSRLVGHGGFAAGEITLSYLDRNPAVTQLPQLFAHEATHILDRKLSQNKPTLLIEGLAVYVAGGHFKPEPLDERAAAALRLNRYIPLAELANAFYPAQHEIGYLEAGAFIKYLVERDGWETFVQMYASFQSAPSDAAMLDAGLRANYGLTLAEMETEWLDYLRGLPPLPDQVEDLRLSVVLFDTLRRYQQALDPAGYFLTAWLPDGQRGRERGIVADFVRQPDGADNVALEAMLDAAGWALQAGEFVQAEEMLGAVNQALDTGDLAAVPLARDYRQIVSELRAQGYTAQDIRLYEGGAEVLAIREWPLLEALTLVRAGAGWQVL